MIPGGWFLKLYPPPGGRLLRILIGNAVRIFNPPAQEPAISFLDVLLWAIHHQFV